MTGELPSDLSVAQGSQALSILPTNEIDGSDQLLFSVDGYWFKGWSKGNNEGAEVLTDPFDVNVSDLDLYALWDQGSVTYDSGDGSGGPVVENGGLSYSVSELEDLATQFSFDGHRFSHWVYQGTDTRVDPQDELNLKDLGDVTLVAQWNQLFPVSFSGGSDPAGDGSVVSTGSISDLEGIDGEQGILPDGSGFSAPGLVVTHWSTQDDNTFDSGTDFTLSDNFPFGPTAPSTLYAVWGVAQDVTVTFDAGADDASAPEGNTITDKVGLTRQLPNGAGFSRTDYYISGWIDRNGTPSPDDDARYVLSATDFVMPNADYTLFAEWSQHTVCYDENDPTLTPGSTSCAAGQIEEKGAADYVVAGADTFERDGFNLVGWSKQSGPDAALEYPVDSDFDLVAELNQADLTEKTITLYAVWEEAASGGFSAPTPFDGPVITTDFSGDSFTVGENVTISGTGLDDISSVRFGDTEASVTASENSASFVVPDVEPGPYTLTIESSNGSIGLQQQVTVLASGEVVIGDEADETKGWTSKLNVSEVKMYAKNIQIGSKYQFFVNGEEIAWVRKNSETDIEGSNLRQALGTDYMVRTVELMPGKNALEVFIDGTRVWRAAYGG